MGPFLAARAYLPQSAPHWTYSIAPVTRLSVKPLRWLLIGDDYSREGKLPFALDTYYKQLVHCTTLTTQGYLDWGDAAGPLWARVQGAVAAAHHTAAS